MAGKKKPAKLAPTGQGMLAGVLPLAADSCRFILYFSTLAFALALARNWHQGWRPPLGEQEFARDDQNRACRVGAAWLCRFDGVSDVAH
jgi:hypothetical protein